MAFFPLSGITGCISPVTATTTNYAVQYNDTYLLKFYKTDTIENLTYIYSVICVFINHSTIFKFTSSSDRDTFYDSLL